MGLLGSKLSPKTDSEEKFRKTGRISGVLKVNEPEAVQDENILLFRNEDFAIPRNIDANGSAAIHTRTANSSQRPLVVIIAWMTAKEKHLQKYRELYCAKGFDVLTVQLKITQALQPEFGSQVVAKKLLDYLAYSKYNQIIIHAFSIGGYLFGECLLLMQKYPEKYRDVTDRMKGLVFDSILDYQQAKVAIPKILTRNPLLQFLLETLSKFFLWLFHNSGMKHYIASSRAFHEIILDCPILVFASPDDELDNFEAIEIVVQDWRSNDRDVHCKYFEKSGHVQHFLKYPEEYSGELETFLRKISIL